MNRHSFIRLGMYLPLVCFFFYICSIKHTSALFNDHSTLPKNFLDAAVVDISTTPVETLFSVSQLLPGDTISRPMTVRNAGDVGFTYTITSSSQNDSILFTDMVDGLQVQITDGATEYYNGPISNLPANPVTPLDLNAGESENLTIVVRFPLTAGNEFQNLSEEIIFTFTATQLPGAAR